MAIPEIDALAGGADPVGGAPLSEAAAEGWLPGILFTCGPPGRVGVELEFAVHATGDPPRRPEPHQLRQAHAEAEAQLLFNRFTAEPGGQLELSSPPAPDLPTVIGWLEQDLARVRAALARRGLRLVGRGVDPLPLPPRILDQPRYAAMETYLDRWGPAGRTMMRRTASVQVNVEAGMLGQGPEELRERWDLLHAAGPVLAAAFDTSGGERQRTWLALDPRRCRPPRVLPAESLPEAVTRWVLDAPLMMVRRAAGPWTAPPDVSFRDWVRGGVPRLPVPTLDDLRYHLTTLFPPVRPRGHLEIRYLDAQPGPYWRVAAAAVLALLDDDHSRDRARAACEPVAGDWQRAAGPGLTDPALARAATQLLALAAEALARAGGPGLAGLTHEYLDRKPTATEAEPC